MGTSPAVPTGSVRPQAQANAAARKAKGELVHITNAQGALVKRPDSFEWEKVPEGGITVHQGAQIRVPKGMRATISSSSRGTHQVAGGRSGTLAELTEIKPQSPRSKVKFNPKSLTQGVVRVSQR